MWVIILLFPYLYFIGDQLQTLHVEHSLYRNVRIQEDARIAQSAERMSAQLDLILSLNSALDATKKSCLLSALTLVGYKAVVSTGRAIVIAQKITKAAWLAQAYTLKIYGHSKHDPLLRPPGLDLCTLPNLIELENSIPLEHTSRLGGYRLFDDNNSISWNFYNPNVRAL